MTIPVVLIHQGQSERYPLSRVKEHDAKFGNEVVVISDSGGDEKLKDFYPKRASLFASKYVHLSSNHVAFEKFCIERWYVLATWMAMRGVDRVLYTDSDVLLYCNAEQEWPLWGEGYAFTLALGTSAATSYFTLAGLNAFLDYVDAIYLTRNPVFRECQRIFSEMQAQNLAGGISDMYLFKSFREQVTHVKVGEMTEIKEQHTWDHNINSADDYATKDGHKEIRLDKRMGLPYGTHYGEGIIEPVHFNSLHFQGGGGKQLLKDYLR